MDRVERKDGEREAKEVHVHQPDLTSKSQDEVHHLDLTSESKEDNPPPLDYPEEVARYILEGWLRKVNGDAGA